MNHQFQFSTHKQLGANASCCRILTITLLLTVSLIVPVVALLDYFNIFEHQISIYSWFVYILVFNSVMLLWLPKYLASSVAYPFSNSWVNDNQQRTTNQRFGMEFKRCVERMTRMIRETCERQNHDFSSSIITGKMMGEETTEQDSEGGNLNPKDIYMRVASNLELIQLYTSVNEKLIQEDPRRQSALFRRATASLSGIKATLDMITVNITFKHQWFPEGSRITYWQFFNRFNLETEKKDQAVNVKKFFIRYQPPMIPKTQPNLQNLERLIMLTEEFTECVNTSMSKCCCLFSCNDVLFGRLDQAKLILRMTFEGKQFLVDGPDGNQIDCMFFPCTQKEQVELVDFKVSKECTTLQPEKEYMSKPTVMMCNPNALYYQQMVIAPNAYWLNFFLKRDINVICWNYRGYGASTIGTFDYASPTKAKLDAERVLAHSCQVLGLQGKIGVYGRSIGGIAACHLASKYPEVVEALMIDRSMNELKDWIQTKAKGSMTITLYEQFLSGWDCCNSENFVNSPKCFKILTCDPVDDTIDQFVSTMAGIGRNLAKHNYETEDYGLFMRSLIYLTEMEDSMYNENDWASDEYSDEVLRSVQKLEREMAKPRAQNQSDLTGEFSLQTMRQQRPPNYQIVYMLVMMVSDLQAATMKLSEVIGVTRQPNFKEFVLFWQLAEVYGGGYNDDVDHSKFNLRAEQTHRQSFIIQLQKLIQAYQITLASLQTQTNHPNPQFHLQFTRLILFQKDMFTKLLQIQTESVKSQDNDYQNKIEGHLVQFSCGHRGQPSRIEEKRISRLLRKSGFIPMLEDMPPPTPVKLEKSKSTPNKLGKPPTGMKPPPSKPSTVVADKVKVVGRQSDNQPKPSKIMVSIEESPHEDQQDQSFSDALKRAEQDSDEDQLMEESRLLKKMESENDYEDISADNVTDQKINDDIRHSIKKDAFFGRPSKEIQAEDSYFFGIDRSESSRHSIVTKLVSPPVGKYQRQRFMSLSNNDDLYGNLLDQPSQANARQPPRGGSMASINQILKLKPSSDELL